MDFDGPGPNPPVEVFSLLIDTDHRDLGAMVRYDRRLGTHDLLAGLNYGDGSVKGGNYRNNGGRPNGISEYVDNTADSVEAFVVDRWRASDRWTAVFGAQVVSAGARRAHDQRDDRRAEQPQRSLRVRSIRARASSPR